MYDLLQSSVLFIYWKSFRQNKV